MSDRPSDGTSADAVTHRTEATPAERVADPVAPEAAPVTRARNATTAAKTNAARSRPSTARVSTPARTVAAAPAAPIAAPAAQAPAATPLPVEPIAAAPIADPTAQPAQPAATADTTTNNLLPVAGLGILAIVVLAGAALAIAGMLLYDRAA